MTEIDLTKYTVDELLELNNKIVSRIKEMRKNQVEEQVKKLKMGDIVTFNQAEVKIYSMVLNISRNKVTVIAENRKRYTVHAMALTQEDDKGNNIKNKIQTIIDKEIHDVMNGLRSLK